MKKVFRVIDAISDRTGNIVQWLCIPLVLIISYETIMRYIFSISTLWEYETVCMMGATMYSLSFAYVMRHNLNVRVDVIYANLSRRIKAAIDSVGMLIAFFPVMTLVVISSFKTTQKAYAINEKMAITGWYPPAAPIRTVVTIGFSLLLLQGLIVLIREIYYLIRNKAYD